MKQVIVIFDCLTTNALVNDPAPQFGVMVLTERMLADYTEFANSEEPEITEPVNFRWGPSPYGDQIRDTRLNISHSGIWFSASVGTFADVIETRVSYLDELAEKFKSARDGAFIEVGEGDMLSYLDAELQDVPVVIEAFAIDEDGESPEYAVAHDASELLRELQRLTALVQDNDLLEVRTELNFDWGTDLNFDWANFDLNLVNDQLVVSGRGEFYFTAFVDSAGYAIESRSASCALLAGQVVLALPGSPQIIAADSKVAADIQHGYEMDRVLQSAKAT